MRPSVHVNGPVQRPPELNVVGADVPRKGFGLLEDARSAEASPLVGGRVRSALIFRCSPDRLRGRVRPHAAGFVEGDPKIVAQWRLSLRAERARLLVVLQTPFPGKIGRTCLPADGAAAPLAKRQDID